MRKSSQKFKNLCMKDQRVSRKLLMEMRGEAEGPGQARGHRGASVGAGTDRESEHSGKGSSHTHQMSREVASLWKALEMGPWGAQERQQQQGMVPFLGAFLDYLQLLDTEIEDYLQKFQVIKEIQLLQEAANECHLQPEE
nr:uncharacterized protein LOC106825763 isoform X2 [Equus asinus]